MLAELIFWVLVGFVFYTYTGYPAILMILGRVRSLPVYKKLQDDTELSSVSVIIAARNEETTIGARLENLSTQDYPKDRFEIVVVSDGSNDRTGEIVALMAANRSPVSPEIRLVRSLTRQGKPTALNAGVVAAKGQIIVFADCRQTFAKDAIRHLVANFADPDVGCVSGELLFVKGQGSSIEEEMGAYWRYEKAIRKMESAIGSVVGATGAIYAIRRALYVPIPAEILLDDVYCPIQCCLQSYRVVFDGQAIAFDTVSKDVSREWQRKVRTLGGNWQLAPLIPLLWVRGRWQMLWQLLSHKVARLLGPFLLAGLLMVSVLCEGTSYRVLFWLQITAYLICGSATLIPGLRKLRIVSFGYFFLVLNVAALVGWWRWMRGDLARCWVQR